MKIFVTSLCSLFLCSYAYSIDPANIEGHRGYKLLDANLVQVTDDSKIIKHTDTARLPATQKEEQKAQNYWFDDYKSEELKNDDWSDVHQGSID